MPRCSASQLLSCTLPKVTRNATQSAKTLRAETVKRLRVALRSKILRRLGQARDR